MEGWWRYWDHQKRPFLLAHWRYLLIDVLLNLFPPTSARQTSKIRGGGRSVKIVQFTMRGVGIKNTIRIVEILNQNQISK